MQPLHGVFAAVVVDVLDPQRRGRARLRIPQISGAAVTTWASPAGHGAVDVGDRVTVAHDGSDASYPLFWPSRPLPPPAHPRLTWTDVTGIAPKFHADPLGGWIQPQVAAAADGLVHVQGLLFADSALVGGDTLFTLPSPPPAGLIFSVAGSASGSVKVSIVPSGDEALFAVHDTPDPEALWLSLSGIRYLPA
ncbi:hypothetical protein ACFVGM_08850 [Kitasatospora purpeofusca]|uniref:hypothetical protein n=1 Tax=Kitasatospora purpeofusca TaxID=67352 RepID=UPI0036921D45